MKKATKRVLWGSVVVASLAGAGAYYLYGTEKGKEHRKEMLAWMKKAEREVMAKVKKLKETAFTKEKYEEIVAAVAKKYRSLKNVEAADVAQFILNVNRAWKDLKETSDKVSKDLRQPTRKSLTTKTK